MLTKRREVLLLLGWATELGSREATKLRLLLASKLVAILRLWELILLHLLLLLPRESCWEVLLVVLEVALASLEHLVVVI